MGNEPCHQRLKAVDRLHRHLLRVSISSLDMMLLLVVLAFQFAGSGPGATPNVARVQATAASSTSLWLTGVCSWIGARLGIPTPSRAAASARAGGNPGPAEEAGTSRSVRGVEGGANEAVTGEP